MHLLDIGSGFGIEGLRLAVDGSRDGNRFFGTEEERGAVPMVEILAVFGAAVGERGIAFRLEITLGRTEQGAVVLLLDNGIGTEAGRFLHNRGAQTVGRLAAVYPSHAAAAELLL